jgi:AcrR family transcriptional regulator
MRLSTEQRRRQLMGAAMRLFSAKGFDGTTTREIAHAAGINEAIIFRHFPSKEALYWAVVSSRIRAAGRRETIRHFLGSAHMDPKEVLAGIAESLLDRTREDADLTRLLLFSALRNAKLSDSFFRTYMAETYNSIADFIRAGIRSGRFRKIDPVVGARAFMGMISQHILLQELLGGVRKNACTPRSLGRQLADIWLNGMALPTSKVNGLRASREPKRNGHAPEEPRTRRTVNGPRSPIPFSSSRNGQKRVTR